MFKTRALVLALALLAPSVAAASPACQGCQAYCETAFPGDEAGFLNCFVGCYDEYGFQCQRDTGGGG